MSYVPVVPRAYDRLITGLEWKVSFFFTQCRTKFGMKVARLTIYITVQHHELINAINAKAPVPIILNNFQLEK